MSEMFRFALVFLGFFLAAAGYIWLLRRAFRESDLFGTLVFFIPPLALIWFLVHPRRGLSPVLLILFGAALVAVPYGAKYYPRWFIDLGPRVRTVDDEVHLTLTGWDRTDYKSILEAYPDAVVLQMANGDVSDDTLAPVLAMQNLRELDLNDTKISDKTLRALAQMPALQDLRLRKTLITEQGLRDLMAEMPNLMKLETTGAGIPTKMLRDWKNARADRDYIN